MRNITAALLLAASFSVVAEASDNSKFLNTDIFELEVATDPADFAGWLAGGIRPAVDGHHDRSGREQMSGLSAPTVAGQQHYLVSTI